MTYADSTTITTLLNTHSLELSEDIVALSITITENIINGKLGLTTSLTPIPLPITDASNLYAAAFVLDVLYSNQDKRSPTAIQYEANADVIMKPYLDG